MITHRSYFNKGISIFDRMNANQKDALNMVSKLTFRKGWNYFLLVLSFHLSRLLKKPLVWGLPIGISVEPTTSCNLRCPECPSGLRSFTRKTGMLSLSSFKDYLRQTEKSLLYLTLYFQGEPFLNPEFFDFVKHAASKNIYTSTSTNAHYLTPENAQKTIESGLDRIIISIDGTEQETYEQYRVGGKLQKVLEGTQNLLSQRKQMNSAKPFVIFQFLAVRPNEHQVEEVKALGKKLGVDEVVIKTAQVYDYENGNPLIPENEGLSRYRKNKKGKFELKNKMLNECWRMWQSCVITWDGKIIPCCFDKDARHTMGDIQADSFKYIWKSSPYNQFRSALLRSRKEIDICKNCTEGTKVWA
jgi:radical SAM protein with 4Fe4S-binding SPASM domain